MYQYQVMMVGAVNAVTIVSPLGSLNAQWQHMRRNDVHKLFGGSEIVMNYTQIIAVTGPNKPFNSLEPNPFPARS